MGERETRFDTLMVKQHFNWMTTMNQKLLMSIKCSNEYKLLRPVIEILSKWNLEDHFDEILMIVFGSNNADAMNHRGIAHWKQSRLMDWLSGMKFLGQDAEKICRQIQRELLDGETFEIIIKAEQHELLEISYTSYFILRLILQNWWNPIITSINFELLPSVPLGVIFGKVCDLSNETEETALQAIEANNRALEGVGFLYGQIIALGYTEHRIMDKKWIPYGFSNNKFLLKRRKVPNGFNPLPSQASGESGNLKKIFFDLSGLERTDALESNTEINHLTSGKQEIVVEYQSSPLYDLYQFGRAIHSTNDFVIPGYLHMGEDGVYTGPVSRWSFRILCERLPPYRSFIYAGGFNDFQELRVHGSYFENEEAVDGFAKFGVRLFQPMSAHWVEVSVLGRLYESKRQRSDIPILPISSYFGNQLVDGTIIDIGGIILMYQDPITIMKGAESNAMKYIEEFMSIKPQCPVLFNEIHVSYTDQKDRYAHVAAMAEEEDIFPLFHRLGPVHIPSTDYSHIPEDLRSYIYPSCGHVYGYHRSLEENACPLCRQTGCYVPIAIAHEPTLSRGPLTHVFNPCGHVASAKCCNYWGNMLIFSRQVPSYGETTAICPFCGVELIDDKPFSKIILPTGKINSDGETDPHERTEPFSRLDWSNPQFQQALFHSQQKWFETQFVSKDMNQLTVGNQIGNQIINYPVYAPQLKK